MACCFRHHKPIASVALILAFHICIWKYLTTTTFPPSIIYFIRYSVEKKKKRNNEKKNFPFLFFLFFFQTSSVVCTSNETLRHTRVSFRLVIQPISFSLNDLLFISFYFFHLLWLSIVWWCFVLSEIFFFFSSN